MSGRMTLGSLFVLAALFPGLCQAQSGYAYGPSGSPDATSAPGQLSPQYAGYQAPPAGYQGPPQQSNNTIFERIPDDVGFLYDDTPVEKFLENTFRHAYFRGEYLLFSVSAPRYQLLGQTPTSGFLEPSYTQPPTGNGPTVPAGTAQPIYQNTFVVSQDPVSTASAKATAIEPSLAGFDIRNLNGYRGTMGLPVGPGAVELSSWILATGSNVYNGNNYITPSIAPVPPATTGTLANYIGQNVTVDGSQRVLLYTGSYAAQLKTSLWGAEANYVFDAPNAGTGDLITFSPIVGMRYLNFRETFGQSGTYQFLADPTNPQSTTLTTANRSIYSQSNNHAYGPQFGVRAEMAISRVVLGVEPKIMLGVNTYDAGLTTSPLDASATSVASSVFNSTSNFQKTATMFSPIAELKCYTRINISQYMNAYFGYNLMFIGSTSRPYNNMSYNFGASGAGMFNPTFSDVLVQGLMMGGEIRY